jgi:hypothetical protein
MAAEPLLLTPQAARWWRIEQALRRNACLNFNSLRHTVGGVSAATLKRDLQTMRTVLDAPIVYDKWGDGYRLVAEWPGLLVKIQEEASALQVS